MNTKNTIDQEKLNGKIVELIIQESKNLKILSGKDIKTGDIYVLRIDEKH